MGTNIFDEYVTCLRLQEHLLGTWTLCVPYDLSNVIFVLANFALKDLCWYVTTQC